MPTSPRSLTDVVCLPSIGQAIFADLPAWLWDVASGSIVFANAAGVSFFSEPDLSALIARHFDMRRPGLRQLQAMAGTLPEDGTSRLFMFRFFVGLRGIALPCSCRLVLLEGKPLVFVAAIAGNGDKREVEDRAAVLFDTAKMPVAVLRDGQIIYRNDNHLSSTDNRVVAELPSPAGPLQLMLGANVPLITGKPQPTALETAEPDERREVAPAPSPTANAADRLVSHRFSFLIDAEHRFAEIGPALAAIVGAASADIVGREWRELAETLDIDPEGKVESALLQRDTWSGVELQWPMDTGGTATVRLAALPRFDDARRFAGFRGFGDVIAVAPLRQGGRAVRQHEADEPGAEVGQAPEAADAETGDAEGNVIHLAPERQSGGTGDGHLNDQERTAFKTIAKALGVEAPEEGGAEAPANREPAAGPPPDSGENKRSDAAPVGDGMADQSAAGRLVEDLLDRLPVGLAIVRNESIRFANRTFLDIFDYTDIDDLEIAGGLSILFEGRSGEADAAVVRRRDGELIKIESRIGRLVWTDGPAMFVTARQIAEPQQPAPADAEDITDLKAILDTASDGVLILSGDGQIEGANRSAEALFSRDSADMVGRAFSELLAPASQPEISHYLEGLASGGVMSVLNDGREIIARAHRGGDVPLFLTIGRIGEREPARFCAVMRDLTQWKSAEAELVAARKRAEDASAHKSDFLAKMSHEIRTPLNAIIGFAEVILEERFGPIGNDRYRDYLKDVRQSGEHIMSLVNDLLDLSKIEAGKLDLNFARLNLGDIVEETVAIMQPQANREQVIIRTSLARRLPAVVADARSLRQVMLNLLSNGIKFTSPGGQVIVSTMLSDDGEIMLRIRDTGIGMSESDIQEALQPFRQLSVKAKTPEKGTGLGLPLTRALVEANRAHFAISSQVNEGTLVEISFPRSRALAE